MTDPPHLSGLGTGTDQGKIPLSAAGFIYIYFYKKIVVPVSTYVRTTSVSNGKLGGVTPSKRQEIQTSNQEEIVKHIKLDVIETLRNLQSLYYAGFAK